MKRLLWFQPENYCLSHSLRDRLHIIYIGLVRAIALGSIATVSSTAAWLYPIAIVQAYTTEDLLTVSLVTGEDYTALAHRAELAARSMAQRRFDSDILLTRVIITVLGDNGGQMAPILVMNVNRNDWRNRPDPQLWSKYYYSTPRLLQLDGTATPSPTPSAPISPLPSATPTPQSTPQPTPSTPSPQIERDRSPIFPSNQTPSSSQPIFQPNTQPTSQPTLQPTPVPTSQPTDPTQLPRSTPPTVNIPATPPGQVGLPRSILR